MSFQKEQHLQGKRKLDLHWGSYKGRNTIKQVLGRQRRNKTEPWDEQETQSQHFSVLGYFWGEGEREIKNHCTSLNFSDRKALVLWSYCLSSRASPFQLFFCSVQDMMMHKTYFQHQRGEDASHTAIFTCSSTDFLEPFCFIFKATRTGNTSQLKGLPGVFSWYCLRKNTKSISRNTSLHILQHLVTCSPGTC